MDGVLATNLAWIIALLIDFSIRVAAVIIIPRGRKPSSAMAWLLAIFFIPFIGVFLFLLIGSPKLPRARRQRQHEIDQLIVERSRESAPAERRGEWPPWFGPVVELNTTLGRVPILGGNTAVLIQDYAQSIADMARDIDRAAWFVHVEFYIVSFDDATRPFFTAMEAAVQRGVTVRLLLDHIASVRAVGNEQTIAELERIGVKWSYMLPVQPLKGKYQRPDLRNHRKLLVVDGRVAFVGSQNLIDRSYNAPKNIRRGLMWQELMTRVTGPAVSGINAVFLSDWYSETNELMMHEHVRAAELVPEASTALVDCQVVPSGPGYDMENNLRLFLALVHSAQERVIVTSPYFVPDEAMMYALTSACQRGLEVHLYVSEIGDQGPVYHAQRSYYGELLAAGVRIYLYPPPYVLHAKHMSIDDTVAVIGSSNVDIRSFTLNLEISLVVHGTPLVQQMREIEAGYRAISRELTAEEWAREPRSSTVLDGVARLTSALQ